MTAAAGGAEEGFSASVVDIRTQHLQKLPILRPGQIDLDPHLIDVDLMLSNIALDTTDIAIADLPHTHAQPPSRSAGFADPGFFSADRAARRNSASDRPANAFDATESPICRAVM